MNNQNVSQKTLVPRPEVSNQSYDLTEFFRILNSHTESEKNEIKVLREHLWIGLKTIVQLPQDLGVIGDDEKTNSIYKGLQLIEALDNATIVRW